MKIRMMLVMLFVLAMLFLPLLATTNAQAQSGYVAITKTGEISGNTITYVVTVTNVGNVDATDVVVTDVLPGGPTFVSATQTGGLTVSAIGTEPNITVFGTTATLTAGTTATITIVSQVDTTTYAGSAFVNTATVTSTINGNTTNSMAQATVIVPIAPAATANLSITKISNISGNVINNTITVMNNGPDTATNVVITDPLPAGTTFAGGTFVTDTGTASGTTDPGIGANGTITGTLATLPNGGIATLWVTSIVAPGTPVGTVITNTATVASATADPVSTNNTAASNVTTTFTAPQETFTVCHRNNGSKGQKTITAGSQAAYDAHINHGDTPGPCSSGS